MQLVCDLNHRFRAIWLPLTQPHPGKSSDLYLGFQCLSADTITNFLFATCFDQLLFPDFQGDIVKGVDIGTPILTITKFFPVVIWFIRYFPPSILMVITPTLKGVLVFRRVSIEGLPSCSSIKPTPLGSRSPGQERCAKPEAVG